MNIDAPVRIENTASPERTMKAKQIHRGLRENVGKATLFGFHGGNVYVPTEPGRQRELQISRIYTNNNSVQELYRQMGFTRNDIASGILGVYDVDGPDTGPLPHVINHNPPPKRILYMSATGKVFERDQFVEGAKESFHRTKLDDYVREGIQRLAFLSSVPQTILDTFGSYKGFTDSLGIADMSGIETKGDLHELQNKVTYYSGPDGRLKEYVESLEQARKGMYSSEQFHISEDDVKQGDFSTFFDRLSKSAHRQNRVLQWISQRIQSVHHK